jgi:hypothetical protein
MKNYKPQFQAVIYLAITFALAGCILPKKSNSEGGYSPPSPSPSSVERPCSGLTQQTVTYSNLLRSRYPNANSNRTDACRFYGDFANYLQTQILPRTASCDPSGKYAAGLQDKISSNQAARNQACR